MAPRPRPHALMTIPEWLSTWAKGVKSSLVWSATAAMTPLCSHTNGIKQRYPTRWLCQYSRFIIDLRSNTLIIPLRCSENANMAARCPDVENNPGCNQVNIRYTPWISTNAIDKLWCWIPSALLKSLQHVKISPREFSYQYFQCSGLSWKSCRSWSEFWEIQTLIWKEMCKKFLVLTKSCRSQTDGLA